MTDEWNLPRKGTPDDPLRIGVLISGSGSGMEALLLHQASTNCLHVTNVVISDREGVAGLGKAQNYDVTSVVVPIPDVEDKLERRILHEQEINEVLADYGVEVVILSGYMRILTPSFVKPWAGRLLNIHPSLLPDFPGAHAHRDAIKAGVSKSGCTVHFVNARLDSGKIILQKKVKILKKDTELSLAKKILVQEHKLYPKAILKVFNL